MAIDVSKLVPDPKNLKEGTNTVRITYFGVVNDASDNPVRLKLFIEPAAPLFFIDEGEKVKVLKNVVDFSYTAPTIHEWNVEILVDKTFNAPNACALRLEATDSHGYKSSTNSFVIYF